ncbi:MAG TPA: hypothetical protein VNO54_06720 [Streptosporangiaceae bacterium]|nr:hypothetical protein [Streptosporangiaceae bacterium]
MGELVKPGDYLVLELTADGPHLGLNPDPGVKLTREAYELAVRDAPSIYAVWRTERIF